MFNIYYSSLAGMAFILTEDGLKDAYYDGKIRKGWKFSDPYPQNNKANG